MADYLQHGNRHRPLGSDPIAGIEGAWALYGGNGASNVTSAGLTYIGIDWWTWGPSNQDAFSLGAGTGLLSGLAAPQVDAGGVYKVSVLAGINGTAGDEFEAELPGAYADWHNINTQAHAFGKLKIGALDPAEPAYFFNWTQMEFIGGSLSFASVAPWSSVFRVAPVGLASAFTIDVLEILIELMSSDYDTTLTGAQIP